MKDLILYMLFSYSVSFVLNKWGVSKWLNDRAESLGSRFLYELSSCWFCIDHWTGFVIALIKLFLYGGDWYEVLIYSMAFAGFSNIVKKISL